MGMQVLQLFYPATLGACNSEKDFSLDACEQAAGPGIMYADKLTGNNATMHAFIRFDLDGKLAGKTVDGVVLRLVAPNIPQAQSDSSGEIWKVTPFTEDSLWMGQPEPIGSAPLAGDVGATEPTQEHYWSLPLDLVAPGAPVFLAIDNPSEDSVDYWNDDGEDPPLLIINYH